MRFKISYILFFVLALLYSSVRVFGGLTPRNLVTVYMFIICFWEDRRLYWDKWLTLYSIFVFFFGLSSAITGYLTPFLRRLIGFYFVAYVGYWSTIILAKKYNALPMLAKLFIFIGLLDAFFTIGQFFNISFITSLPPALGIIVDDSILDSLDTGDEAFGLSLPGIMATDVYNGYFLMVVGILSLYFLKGGFKFIALVPWGVSVVASFMVQQRGPFYILVLLSMFMLYRTLAQSKSKFKVAIIMILLFALPFAAEFFIDYLMSGDSRFNIGLASTNRDIIFQQCLTYINDHILLGGYYQSKLAPHNQILSAWIMGGLVGVVIILWMVVSQSILSIKLAFSRITESSFVYIVFSLAFLGFTMNSMLHNAGIISGDLVLWILWGVIKDVKISKRSLARTY